MKKPGFTLIELLVTISIITILATIGIAVFNTVQKNNRDQIRMRDLQAIKQALELYRSDNGGYPATADVPTKLVTTYLSSWPADPINGRVYAYSKTPTGFAICAKKEGNIADFTPCTSYDCTPTADKCNIGLQSD